MVDSEQALDFDKKENPEDGIENQDSDCPISHTTLWSDAIWLDHSTPVMAQEAVTLKHDAISATPSKMMMEGGASLAASGDHLYVLN